MNACPLVDVAAELRRPLATLARGSQCVLKRRTGDRSPVVDLGTNLGTGETLHLPLLSFTETHTLVAGRSGGGKSKLVELIGRAVLHRVKDDGWSLAMLDGKGGTVRSLSDDLFAYGAQIGIPISKLVFFDPHQAHHLPGFNFLELIGDTTPATRAERLLETLAVMLKMDDGEYRPWWSEWGKGSLIPLIEAGLTLTELLPFLSLDDPAFRDAVLARAGNTAVTSIWREFTNAFRIPERAKILNVVRTRAKEIVWNELTVALYGQTRSAVDFKRLMDDGGAFIAKLGDGPRFSESQADFVGKGIVHQVMEAAHARKHRGRKPCVILVDEFERFSSRDFERGLDVLRGYGVHLILVAQHLGQLRKDRLHLYESAMSNARIKMVFTVSREDAEALANEIFTHFGEDRVIETFKTPFLRPVESTRLIRGLSEAETSTETWHDTDGSAASTSHVFLPSPEGTMIEGAVSENAATHSARGATGGDAYGRVESSQRVPWYEYELEERVAHRRAWSVEQLREQAIAAIMRQPDRHYWLHLFGRNPVPMISHDVGALSINPRRLARALEKNEERFPAIADVVTEVRNRVAQFVDASPRRETPMRVIPRRRTEPWTF